MKKSIILFLLFSGLFIAKKADAQGAKDEIKKVLKVYVAGGDHNKSEEFAASLVPEFRVAFSNPAENKLSFLDKTTYCTLIDNKTFGGDKREVIIESIEVLNDLTASVTVKLKGEKATMRNFFSFAKLNGKWMIVQDMVFIDTSKS